MTRAFTFFFSVFFFWVSKAAISALPSVRHLLCFSTDSEYQFSLDTQSLTAIVTKQFKEARFGHLSCSMAEPGAEAPLDTKPQLLCHSTNVADAGFQVLYYSGRLPSEAYIQLYESWFAGAKLLAILPCRGISGTEQNRVLWTSGEFDIPDVTVAAGGKLEINIRTAISTGYEWSLASKPSSHTVEMKEKPRVIRRNDASGGVGIIRFLFQVDNHPRQDFDLTFQLKRQWENQVIQQFTVRLHAR